MNRREFLQAAAVATVLATAPRAAQAQSGHGTTLLPNVGKAPPPNIILVMSDDQGWGDVGYNGHPVLQTPNLDEMAANSLRFDRFYAAAPSCGPTRASVMTGRHPNRCNVRFARSPLPASEISLATLLRQSGYATGHFGKWGLGQVDAEAATGPAVHGFDRWVSHTANFDWNPELHRNGELTQYTGEGSMVVVDAAIDFIRQQRLYGKPFLAVVWLSACHDPYKASAADRALYGDQTEEVQQFYGEITAMDRAIGKLRDALRTLEISENTIVWYCSDNGGPPELASNGGRAHKHTTYEGGLRVPSLLEWPARIRNARRTSVPAVTTDIFHTLLEIAEVDPPQDREYDGVSLLRAINGAEVPAHPIGFWFIRDPDLPWPYLQEVAPASRGQVAWLDWPWKLHKRLTSEYETKLTLYHLASDPDEACDAAATNPERVTHMLGQLERWQSSVLESMEQSKALPP